MVGIVMLGLTTSGKSTIGKYIAKELGLRYISSGDIARQMDCDEILNRGELAPEDEMRRRLLAEINLVPTSYVLDGCPRFVDQYEWLKANTDHKLIYLDIHISYSEVSKRSGYRNRSDDSKQAINVKLNHYIDNIAPLIDILADKEESYYRISNNAGEDAKKPIVLAIVRSELDACGEI